MALSAYLKFKYVLLATFGVDLISQMFVYGWPH